MLHDSNGQRSGATTEKQPMHSHLRSLAIQQLHALDDHIRLIVIHPNYLQQHLVLSEYIDQPAAYVRFDGLQLKQQQLDEQFNAALMTQHVPDETEASLVLLLDECDRACLPDLNAFLQELLRARPKNRIVVFSRLLPHELADNPDLRQILAFIPYDTSSMLWNYAQRDEDLNLLEVRSFGEGRVILNGRQITNWDGVLPRSLFFYLVDRGMTTRNEIFDIFWPNLNVREATNVFHVTKRKVSEVLGLDLTTYWSGFYRIASEIHLSYDVVLFTEMLQASAVEPENADHKLSRAIDLYNGHFLSMMDMDWAKRRRHELAQDYSEALVSLAKVREEAGRKEEALGLYLRASTNNRHREDLATSIMKLYREQHMYEDALKVYTRLSHELDEDLGVTPAQHIQEMAANIRQEMEHAAAH